MMTAQEIEALLAGHIKLSYGACSCGVQFPNHGLYSAHHRRHVAAVLADRIAA